MSSCTLDITNIDSDLFGCHQSSLIRSDRDTTCGSGIEVEYVGSRGKLLYHCDADRLFTTHENLPVVTALNATTTIKFKGTGIHPNVGNDECATFGRELCGLTKKIARAARRILRMRRA